MIKAKYQKMYTEEFMKDMDFVILGDYYIGPFIDRKRAEIAAININKVYNQLLPKPRTEIQYEHVGFHKCHEAMFKHEIEEKLYRKYEDGYVEADLTYIANNWVSGLYREVEKEIDWRDEVSDFLTNNNIPYRCNGHQYIKTISDYTDEQFLEMCRVALRATGELNDGQ